MMGSEEVWVATGASLLVSGSATIIALLIGLPLASWCARNDFPLKNSLRILVRTLYGLPPVVVGVAVYLAISRKGPFGELELLFTIEGMILAQTLLILPLIWGLSWTALEKVPREVLETHAMLGTKGGAGLFTHLREAKAGVSSAILVGFGRAIAEVGAVMIIGGNIAGKTRVLTTSIVLETSQGDLAAALSLGSILLIIALFASVAALFLEEVGLSFTKAVPKASSPKFAMIEGGSVSVDGLGWNVDGHDILIDVDIKIREGGCGAVLGASGCGKSSLLRHVAGLEKKSSGSLKSIGSVMMVHQIPVALHGNVIDNICHAGVSMEEAMWWLQQVGLEDFAKRSPERLSGGERQRMAVVRALAATPSILLLDEFTANLDGPNVEVLENLVRNYLEIGGTVLLATHNPMQGNRMADSMVVLDGGSIIKDDSKVPQSLLDGSWLG